MEHGPMFSTPPFPQHPVTLSLASMVLLLTGKTIHPTRRASGSNVMIMIGLRSALWEQMSRTMIQDSTWGTMARGVVFLIACERSTQLEPLLMQLVTTAVVTVMSI